MKIMNKKDYKSNDHAMKYKHENCLSCINKEIKTASLLDILETKPNGKRGDLKDFKLAKALAVKTWENRAESGEVMRIM